MLIGHAANGTGLPASLQQLNRRPPSLQSRPTRSPPIDFYQLLNLTKGLGVGVGNPTASPTTALLLHTLQDTTSRLATIAFAYRIGTALEPECKRYRLAADVFNDLGMVLNCLSPMVPAGFARVCVLSAAGVLTALCGVAGGSSKATLSAHFARGGNLAEVNAVRPGYWVLGLVLTVARKIHRRRLSSPSSGCWLVPFTSWRHTN